MQFELTVILKSEDSTFRKKFNCYEPISIDGKCPKVFAMVNEAKKEFKLVPDEIQLRIHVEWVQP